MDNNLVNDPFRVFIKYEFEFEDGNTRTFDVDVDLSSKKIKNYSEKNYSWTDLTFHKCEHCPLSENEYTSCPAAVSIIDIVEYFSMHKNYETAKCSVVLPEKTIYVEKKVSEILSCLIGLRMATSLCPYLKKLQMMARFHEPFSTPYYTVYRATSMYLLKQYFKTKNNQVPDWNMNDLIKLYENLGTVNMNISERLKTSHAECGPCSLTILSVFTISMTLLFEEHLKLLTDLNNA